MGIDEKREISADLKIGNCRLIICDALRAKPQEEGEGAPSLPMIVEIITLALSLYSAI